ncbi:DUF222 domain-containing protein [Actinopolymorpha sp. B11F2]|uniref:HNH endonuclease signature motif containing protein n=1 Tax=Actinopolymorpha sp. B11F2 TaxID=3160862 RepID=UPI0032E38929
MRSRLGEELPPVLWSMGEDELIDLLVDLQGLIAQCDAGLLAAISEADRRDLGKTAGATSTTNWLSDMLRIRPGQASRKVKLAKDLDTSLVMTRTEMNAGRISADTADVIAQTMRDLPSEAGPDTRFDAEHAMLEHAHTFHPGELTKIGKTILNSVDPELTDQILAKKLADEEKRAARARELSISDDPYSTSSFVRGKLDAETSEMLRTALEPLAKPRPTTADGPDTRTYAQRMGDGLHELLRRYLDSGESPSHAGEKPHLVIRIDGIRLFVGKTRRLLELRDRGCAFPGCDRPPSWCEGHHVIAWLKGGPTTVANGVLLCAFHHRLTHQGAWTVRIAGDGMPEFVPPPNGSAEPENPYATQDFERRGW